MSRGAFGKLWHMPWDLGQPGMVQGYAHIQERYERPVTIASHLLYDAPYMKCSGKSIETKSTLVLDRGWGKEKIRSNKYGISFFSDKKCSKIR